MSKIDTIKAEVRAALDEAQAIVDAAKTEDRELSADEQTKYDEAVARAEAKDAEAKDVEAREATESRAAELRGQYANVTSRKADNDSNDENELRSLIAGELSARAAVDLPTSFQVGPGLIKGVVSLGDTEFLRPLDKIEVAPMAATIPVAKFGAVTLTDGISQGASLTDGGADITSTNLTITKGAAFVDVANEVLNNLNGAETTIRNKFVRAANRLLANKVVSAIVAETGTDTEGAEVALGDLLALPSLMDADVRSEGFYILSAEMVSFLSNAKGTTNDHYHFNPALGVFTLRGYRVVEAPLESGETAGDVVAAFVHPEAITVAASDFEISRDDSVSFKTDQATFRGIIYTGAIVNDSDYVKALTVAGS